MPREVSSRLRAPDRMQALRRRRRRRRHDIQLRARPVRRHLPPAAGRIVRRAHRLQQLLLNRVAQRKADRPVAIVGKEPVVSRTHRHARRNQQRLVSCARNLEEDLLLPLQHNLAVVGPARQIHQPVELHQLLRRQRSPSPLQPSSCSTCYADPDCLAMHLSCTSNALPSRLYSSADLDRHLLSAYPTHE